MAKRVPQHQVDEQDPGFRAAQAWFLAKEIDMEKREEALARDIGRRLDIDPKILDGKLRHLREQLDAVELLAGARNWSDEMRKIELDRMVELSIEQLRMIPGIERAIRAATRKRDLPALVSAELPGARSVAQKYPDADPKKGSVVLEIKRMLQEKHGMRVSKAQIAKAMPADFASRD
jgi:hypothetical protein